MFFVWVSWSSGLRCCLVWCPLGPAPCSLRCLLSALSFLFVGMFAGDVFLSVFLSLSGAGETQTPFGVWVSPSVSSSWTRISSSTRSSSSSPPPRPRPAPAVFFFFFFDARVGVFCVCVCGSRCLVCVSVCLSVFRSWWVAACTVNVLVRE